MTERERIILAHSWLLIGSHVLEERSGRSSGSKVLDERSRASSRGFFDERGRAIKRVKV
jgi:hypothetical protein